jgi:hypothetical protein
LTRGFWSLPEAWFKTRECQCGLKRLAFTKCLVQA